VNPAPFDHLGDENLGRRYGPRQIALWFAEEKDYRAGNERFWQIRRALIESDIWTEYGVEQIPLVPEWFGMLPFDLARRQSGQAVIWAMMLGFPDATLRKRALGIVGDVAVSGLVKIERSPPDPWTYTLPVVAFLARGVYLTLEPGHPRRYDLWERYESVGLVSDDEVGLMEVQDPDTAERLLLRRLALNLGNHFEHADARTDLKEIVQHARQLWSVGAAAAAATVAGTAMEQVLALSLGEADQEWANKATLGNLIPKVVSRQRLSPEQGEALGSFRELRNECAHAMAGEDEFAPLDSRVDDWLTWLESQSVTGVAEKGIALVATTPDPPPPVDLHNMADEAGRKAAEAITPRPIRLSTDDGRGWTEPEGVCGYAEVDIRPAADPLARWLLERGTGRPDGAGVKLLILWGTQSMERATGYAKAYAETLQRFGLSATYRSEID
jgi:hypothetical protein